MMRTPCRPLLAALLLLAAMGRATAQQPFSCDGDFFFTAANAANSSLLQRIVKDSSLTAMPITKTITNDLGYKVTAIGFNVRDNFIYGLERFTWNLLRIGADGVVVNLGKPLNLDPNLEYYAGEARPLGGALYVIGREPGGYDKSFYTINLYPPYGAGVLSIVSDEAVRVSDMAIDPVFGTMYGFDEVQKRLVQVAVGGLVTSVHYEKQPQLTALGSLFFDRWGNLYGINGQGGQSLVRFY